MSILIAVRYMGGRLLIFKFQFLQMMALVAGGGFIRKGSSRAAKCTFGAAACGGTCGARSKGILNCEWGASKGRKHMRLEKPESGPVPQSQIPGNNAGFIS